MLQYYYGFSKSEKYNDSTGNAYLIKYDTDGTVLSLYKGQFLEGQPSDKTGQAFSIIIITDYLKLVMQRIMVLHRSHMMK
jgi:hypothetical protein